MKDVQDAYEVASRIMVQSERDLIETQKYENLPFFTSPHLSCTQLTVLS